MRLRFLYPGSPQRYDELLERDGAIRAHWQPLIEHLSSGGADAVRRCVEMTRRLIIENGVTYNVYADPQGARPAVAARSAAAADRPRESGARSRQVWRSARTLLNALLADLTGRSA